MMVALAAERRAQLHRRGLRLEYATLGWNVVEIGFLIAAAVSASSVALAGFALDSFIEIFASIVVVRQLKGVESPQGDQRALRSIGVAFFLLALYIVVQAVVTLALGIRPDSSPLGIAWLAATCVVMFGLAAGKSRTGRLLGNPVLSAEAKVTVVDGALAAGILVGLVLNAAFGWWWADIAAARDPRRLRTTRRAASIYARQAEPLHQNHRSTFGRAGPVGHPALVVVSVVEVGDVRVCVHEFAVLVDVTVSPVKPSAWA